MNKPRLIDANKLIKDLEYYFGKEKWAYSIGCLIKDQPTAYDIDKVVEEIENNYFAPGKCVSFIGKSDAIEIVKKGGGNNG